MNKKICTSCKTCVRECPVQAIELDEANKAKITEECVECLICSRICPVKAIDRGPEKTYKTARCPCCPVNCEIPEDKTGACRRYQNTKGKLRRVRPLLMPGTQDWEKAKSQRIIEHPLVLGIGSKYRPSGGPAPYIAEAIVEGVDVVTCVSEAELSYCGPLFVVVDTNGYIGDEGAPLKRDGFAVGNVGPQIYQGQLLLIGSPTTLALGAARFTIARTMIDIMNGKKVKLDVEKGPTLEIQLGEAPIVNGVAAKYTGGCGSFVFPVRKMKEMGIDEEINLAIPITGLHTLHWRAGAKEWSGVMVPYDNISTPGRYHLKKGRGWGKTCIMDPKDSIAIIDRTHAKVGTRILVHEPSGEHAALFEVTEDGIKKIEKPPEVEKVLEDLRNGHEKARVSAALYAGASGGVRSIVTKFPLKLVEAIHSGDVKLTVGGVPTYILPGRGINFLFDVEKVPGREFTYVPTPALVIPLEFTMEKKRFEKIGGYMDYIKGLSEVKRATLSLRDVEQGDPAR